jgi:polysaccharide pyruvyl transferase WcaK-like protein
VARVHRVWRRLLVGSGLPGLVDRAVLRAHFRAEPRERRDHLLLAAPGHGNVGDQALLEAMLENIDGPVTVVVSDSAGLRLPDGDQDRIEVLEFPQLVYGKGAGHRADVARFGRALAHAGRLSIVGADVMDGRYSLPASVRRSSLATAAARLGVDTRIVGFSWSDRARPSARRSLVAAGRSGVRLLLRDPVSAGRARRDGVHPVHEVADVVFAARTVDRSLAMGLLDGISRPVALVNVSGLLAAQVDQLEEYVAIVDDLRRRGLHVLLVPHVWREQGGDFAACGAVAQRVGPAHVTCVRTPPTPAQVRGLAARAVVTVTGRMHLAVMSLMEGVPAVTLATQGKVEGLMQLFSTPELCIPVGPGFSGAVIDAVGRVLPEGSAARVSIRRALPDVVALARRNTEDLPAPFVLEGRP